MKRNNLARFLLLLLILGWAWTEMYPLWNQPGKLIEQFGKATNKDADFDKVLQAANANFDADDKNSNEFGTLYEAVEASGLVLTNYNFPKMTFRGQVPDNRLVLQKLQKQVAGQIQLGLDLRGGSSFLVAIDTNKLENAAGGGARERKAAAAAGTAPTERLRLVLRNRSGAASVGRKSSKQGSKTKKSAVTP